MTAVLWPERHRLEALVTASTRPSMLGVTTSLTLQLLGAVVAVLAVVAIADYFFQYRQWFERQKMSLQEMKEEFKQSEGDPAHQGQDPAVAPAAHEEAHDGRGAQGLA